MRRAALIALLILASCGGDSENAESSAPPPSSTTTTEAPDETVPETEAPPTTEATTTSTTTTTTLPPNAAPVFGISQIVFGDSAFAIITNWGNDSGDLEGHWLGQGATRQELPAILLAPGEQALIGLAANPPPDLTGIAVTIDLGPVIGTVAPTGGEVALYNNADFEDPASLVAYVAWGPGPHAGSELATAAGMWDGTTVEVFDDAPSISSGIYPAASSLDWSPDVGG